MAKMKNPGKRATSAKGTKRATRRKRGSSAEVDESVDLSADDDLPPDDEEDGADLALDTESLAAEVERTEA